MPRPEVFGEVLINGRFVGQRITGVQRYAHETLRALDELLAAGADDLGLRYTLAVPRGSPRPALSRIAVEPLGRLRGHAWEQLELPWRARRALLLSFGFSGPWSIARQIITVHDAAVVRQPQTFRALYRHGQRALVRHIAARAPCTLTVSRFSAGEATACFGVPPERLRITGNGWQHLQRLADDDSLLDAHRLRGERYLLAVSSPTPSKNFAAIEAALARLGPAAPRCVVAGAADRGVFRGAAAPAASPALLRVGYVSDAQLKSLYRHASGFVFPSLYEGFGLPALEAMACGCPVIASTAPALREVCGDAALYFEPQRPEQLAQQIERLFADPALAARLRDRAPARLARYGWRLSAERHLEAIRDVLAQARAAGAATAAEGR